MALVILLALPCCAIDPWCGIGPFFPFLPPDTDVVGIELLQEEASLAQVLNPAATIVRGNTWLDWRRHVGEYDLVIANPPFGPVKQDCAPELGLGARNPMAESLVLEVGVKLLRPGGVMVIIVSHGVLAQKSCLYVRDWIMEQCYLHASISLPPTTFYWQGTGGANWCARAS
jgi:type I restriction-modification system DNA methylase subunit